MTLEKITASFTDRGLAHEVANALQDLIDPAPDALTIFEDGKDAWRQEAYARSTRRPPTIRRETSRPA